MVVERGGARRPRTDRRVRPRDPAATRRPAWRIACFVARDGASPRRQRDADSHARDALPADRHLLQNVVLAEWAPLLVVLAIPPALAAAIARPPAIRALTHPAVALPLWLANYMIWHLPWIYDAALENPSTLLHLEHAMYFVTGLAMWWCVVPGRAAPARLGRARGLRLRGLRARRARSGSSWRSFRARSTTSTSRRTTASGG